MIQEANQQATDREIAYLAAMIEGEGTIALNMRQREWKGWIGRGAEPKVVIANTDSGIIQKCAYILEKLGIQPYVHTYERKGMGKGGQWKDCVQVSVCKFSHVYKLLTTIIPDLAGDKKHKAELIVEFIERRLTRQGKRSQKGGQSWYDEQDWAKIKEIYEYDGKPFPAGFLRDYTHSGDKAEDIVRPA